MIFFGLRTTDYRLSSTKIRLGFTLLREHRETPELGNGTPARLVSYPFNISQLEKRPHCLGLGPPGSPGPREPRFLYHTRNRFDILPIADCRYLDRRIEKFKKIRGALKLSLHIRWSFFFFLYGIMP